MDQVYHCPENEDIVQLGMLVSFVHTGGEEHEQYGKHDGHWPALNNLQPVSDKSND